MELNELIMDSIEALMEGSSKASRAGMLLVGSIRHVERLNHQRWSTNVVSIINVNISLMVQAGRSKDFFFDGS